jgi:hypothetical protein
MKEISPAPPNLEGLIICAKHMASLMELPEPLDAKIRAKLEDILFQQGYFESFKFRIITREEYVNVVFQHLQTFICASAGVPEPAAAMWSSDEEAKLIHEMNQALLGPCD